MDIGSAYEQLYLLNRHLEQSLALFRRLERHLKLPKEQVRIFELQIREVRALVSQNAIEKLNEIELKNAARWYRKRRSMEKRLAASSVKK